MWFMVVERRLLLTRYMSAATTSGLLPKRTAGQGTCPEPESPVASLNDLALLYAVLDGLRRLDFGGCGQ